MPETIRRGTTNPGRSMRNQMRIAVCIAVCVLSGCMGRTGKVGEPIAERNKEQLEKLQPGVSRVDDLKRIFGKRASLKSKDATTETWEVFRGGNADVAQFLLWGQIAHDKDQSLLFHFSNGVLMSWDSYIHPEDEKK
jgi:hypothetical protein